MSALSNIIRGVSWIGLLRGSTRFIAFVKIALIARILTPSEFGLFGIAALVLAFLEIFTETGINTFFVQKEGKLKEYVSTAWVISIGRGIGIALLIAISAPFVSSFFQSPDSLYLILLISLVPLVKGFINPSEIRFQSELKFKQEFWFRFVIFMFDACIAITLSLITQNPSSLIWGLVAGAVLEVILSFVFLSPRPKLSFKKGKAQHIVSRGKWLTGFGIFEYIFRNGDDIVVGKFLGSGALGVYQMAYKLAILPITEVADVFGKVTLPIFVDMAGDKKKLQKALVLTTFGVFVFLLPVSFVIFLFPETIVRIVLGENWLSAAPILRILIFFAMIRALINPALTVFLAMKKQEIVTFTSFVGTVTLFACIIPLLHLYGIIGIAIATVVASLVTVPVVGYYAWKLFRI